MPYQPTVSDTSGQIYGQYFTRAAEAEAEGIVDTAKIEADIRERKQKALYEGVDKLQQGILTGIEKYADYKLEQDNLDAKFEGYKRLGVVTDADNAQYYQGNLGKKRGYVSMLGTFANETLVGQRADAASSRKINEYRAEKGIDEEFAPGKAGDLVELTDKQTGQTRTFLWQNNQQLIPFDTGTGRARGKEEMTITGKPRRVDIGGGLSIYTDDQGRPIAKQFISGTEDENAATRVQSDITALRKIQDELTDHRAAQARNDNRYGFFNLQSRDERVKELQVKEKALRDRITEAQGGAERGPAPAIPRSPGRSGLGTGGGGGSSGGPTAPGPRRYASVAELQRAVANHEIDRETGKEILRDQFGIQ